MSAILLAALLALTSVLIQGTDAEKVSFESRKNFFYDTAPKLRVRGSGFGQLSERLDLLELTFDPQLSRGETYKVSFKADDIIILELLEGKKWVHFEASQPLPRPLTLTGASFQDTALLDDPVTVANLIPTPIVNPASKMVYITSTPYITINGTNFNTKDTQLFFSPPLNLGEDISITVKSSDIMWITLIRKKVSTARWAKEPGPLKLVAIDTGAGKLMLRPDLHGVTIAEIQADMKGTGIKVEARPETALYQSQTKTLSISGSGFVPEQTLFRFANPIKEDTNITSVVTESSATLTLMEGSKWKLNSASLPSPLMLLAVNAGAGWVPVGSTTAKAGRKVATIFEDPAIEESVTEISRTVTHELDVTGTGFSETFPPLLVFDPVIDRDSYKVHVIDRHHLTVTLANTPQGWVPESEPLPRDLLLKHVNTGAGFVALEQGVRVAVVVTDAEAHDSGIVVYPNYVAQLYQSSSESLIIAGQGFLEGHDPKVSFGFGYGPDEGSFTCERISAEELKLSLAGGFQWKKSGGSLFLTEIAFADTVVPFENPGIKVATVLDDPLVEASQLYAYASHTRQITIHGEGFVSYYDKHFKPKVVLHPTLEGDFEVMDGGWNRNYLILVLSQAEGSSNKAPAWANVMSEDVTVALKVVSVDTGAGPVEMPGGGVVVATVRMDDETYLCDDSCIYANDQECDEDQEGVRQGGWTRASSTKLTLSSSKVRQQNRGYVGVPSSSFTTTDDIPRNSAACEMGTDCTDCGLAVVEEGRCLNSCFYARDNSCDDRRGSGLCADGTDCQDCGTWGNEGNFSTRNENAVMFESGAYSDDDRNFLANELEGVILEGQRNNAKGRYHRLFAERKGVRKESESGEQVFMDVLWCAIVLVGVAVAGTLILAAVRCAKGERLQLPIPQNPDVSGRR